MNKKTVMFAAGAAGVILTLSACGADSYEYQVSGDVIDQQIDYDCPKGNLSMEAVAFVSGKHKTTKKAKAKPKAAPLDKKPSKIPSPSATGTKGSGSSPSPRSATPSPSATALKNRGVTLKSKPEKPEKIKKVPSRKSATWHKGCKVDDYEIFVQAKDGTLYEQDVRKVDYDNCAGAAFPKGKKYKLFPLCTKG